MRLSLFRSGKKAQDRSSTGLSWYAIVGLLLFLPVALVIGSVLFGENSIFGIMSSSKVDQSTLAGFNALVAQPNRARNYEGGLVVKLLNEESTKSFDQTYLSVHNKNILIAFDTEWPTEAHQSRSDNFIIYKPDECQDMACICLYHGKLDKDERNKHVYACERFEGNIKFATVFYDGSEKDLKKGCGAVREGFEAGTTISGERFAYAIFYGSSKECGDWGSVWSYVEKHVKKADGSGDNVEAHILITPADTKTDNGSGGKYGTEERKKQIV